MMYFEFIANKEAEDLIYSAFFSVWESIYYRDLLPNMEGTMQGVWTLEDPGFSIYITKSEYKDLIVENEKKLFNLEIALLSSIAIQGHEMMDYVLLVD